LNIIFLQIFKWGLGIGDWGLGPIPNPQSPIPNPQSPFKYLKEYDVQINIILKLIKLKMILNNQRNVHKNVCRYKTNK
jgi:hypothetical protein